MPVPESSPPEPASPDIEQKSPVITRDILQSYLLCKVKGHLKLMAERGSPVRLRDLDDRIEGHRIAAGRREARRATG